MSYNQTPYDIKQTLKKGLLYLLIAFPFVIAVGVAITIAKASLFVTLLCEVVTGGFVVLVSWIIHNKITENKEKKQKQEPKKFDPFKD